MIALTVTEGMVVVVDSETFTATSLGIERVPWVVGVAFAVPVLPFPLVRSYLLRPATLAKQTLPMGPLVLS